VNNAKHSVLDVAAAVKVTTVADGMLWSEDGMRGVWSHDPVNLG
jgi:hypothetical protein